MRRAPCDGACYSLVSKSGLGDGHRGDPCDKAWGGPWRGRQRAAGGGLRVAAQIAPRRAIVSPPSRQPTPSASLLPRAQSAGAMKVAMGRSNCAGAPGAAAIATCVAPAETVTLAVPRRAAIATRAAPARPAALPGPRRRSDASRDRAVELRGRSRSGRNRDLRRSHGNRHACGAAPRSQLAPLPQDPPRCRARVVGATQVAIGRSNCAGAPGAVAIATCVAPTETVTPAVPRRDRDSRRARKTRRAVGSAS